MNRLDPPSTTDPARRSVPAPRRGHDRESWSSRSSSRARCEASARLASDLVGSLGTDSTAHHVVLGAVEAVAAADHVSLVVDDGGVDTIASSSSALAERWTAAQLEVREGPLVDAVETAEPCGTRDLGTEVRWSSWRLHSDVDGVVSVLAVPLVSGDRTTGALTMYSTSTRDLGDGDSVKVAKVHAVLAAVAVAASNEVEGLRTSLRTRHTIGVAQGILMQRYALTPDRAFAVLRRYSNSLGVKLRDVARCVMETGDVPATGHQQSNITRP